jgi:hypothetical protein
MAARTNRQSEDLEPLGRAFVGEGEYVVRVGPIGFDREAFYGPFISDAVARMWASDNFKDDQRVTVHRLLTPREGRHART